MMTHHEIEVLELGTRAAAHIHVENDLAPAACLAQVIHRAHCRQRLV